MANEKLSEPCEMKQAISRGEQISRSEFRIATEKLFSPSDLARAANVSVRTIQRWTAEEKLPENRDGRGWRIYDVAALVRAMELARKRK